MANTNKNEANKEMNGKKSNHDEVLFGGLSYIKNQKIYLIINAIVPIYCLVVQALNLLFTFMFILRLEEIPHEFKRPRAPLFLFDALTPSLLFFGFIIVSIINLFFLLKWRKMVHLYEDQLESPSISEENITLTKIFYDIIDIMENLKKIFIVLNVVFVFYLQWFFRFFINQPIWIDGRTGFPPQAMLSFPSFIMPLPNLFLQILLVIYLFMNWRHFIRWNKKLSKLKDLERQVYTELDLNGELLLTQMREGDLG